MTCKNCGRKLSCGCKKRIAKDGQQCCAACVNSYNANIKITPEPPKKSS